MSRTPRRRGLLLAALVAAGSIVVGACGGPSSSSPEDSPSPSSAPTSAQPRPRTADPAPVTSPTKATHVVSVRMPEGDLPGWKRVFADDFDGKRLAKTWTKYSGQPGGDPDGWWDPSHVVVKDGRLELQTYREDGRWVSGGVGAWRGSGLTYGKIEVRFRAPAARGVAYALLLWPSSENWPVDGEIDFAEDGGGDRDTTTATLHYGVNNRQIVRSLRSDFGRWQTVGVEWTPDTLVYTINGDPWATVRSAGVPSSRMVLALQTQVWGCDVTGYSCPDAGTPVRSSVDVDWVVAYERSSE